MGVWIETSMIDINPIVNQVTPCMGVWIETCSLHLLDVGSACHTLYGCVD